MNRYGIDKLPRSIFGSIYLPKTLIFGCWWSLTISAFLQFERICDAISVRLIPSFSIYFVFNSSSRKTICYNTALSGSDLWFHGGLTRLNKRIVMVPCPLNHPMIQWSHISQKFHNLSAMPHGSETKYYPSIGKCVKLVR